MTKQYNYLIEEFRRKIDVSYRIGEGFLEVSHGPYEPDYSYRDEVLRYTNEEKKKLFNDNNEAIFTNIWTRIISIYKKLHR